MKSWLDENDIEIYSTHSEFYNISMKSWLDENDIEIYSTHSEEKSIVARRFIKTLLNKI